MTDLKLPSKKIKQEINIKNQRNMQNFANFFKSIAILNEKTGPGYFIKYRFSLRTVATR